MPENAADTPSGEPALDAGEVLEDAQRHLVRAQVGQRGPADAAKRVAVRGDDEDALGAIEQQRCPLPGGQLARIRHQRLDRTQTPELACDHHAVGQRRPFQAAGGELGDVVDDLRHHLAGPLHVDLEPGGGDEAAGQQLGHDHVVNRSGQRRLERWCARRSRQPRDGSLGCRGEVGELRRRRDAVDQAVDEAPDRSLPRIVTGRSHPPIVAGPTAASSLPDPAASHVGWPWSAERVRVEHARPRRVGPAPRRGSLRGSPAGTSLRRDLEPRR